MKKIILIIALLAAVFGCASKSKQIITEENFGDETMALLKEGKYNMGCNDAKYVFGLLNNVDFEKSGDYPPSDMKAFEGSIDKLEKEIIKTFENDEARQETAKDSIGKDLLSIIMVSLLKADGRISADEASEHIYVPFCGAKPSETYLPLEELINEESAGIPEE